MTTRKAHTYEELKERITQAGGDIITYRPVPPEVVKQLEDEGHKLNFENTKGAHGTKFAKTTISRKNKETTKPLEKDTMEKIKGITMDGEYYLRLAGKTYLDLRNRIQKVSKLEKSNATLGQKLYLLMEENHRLKEENSQLKAKITGLEEKCENCQHKIDGKLLDVYG